jgi:hypothetical protein
MSINFEKSPQEDQWWHFARPVLIRLHAATLFVTPGDNSRISISE